MKTHRYTQRVEAWKTPFYEGDDNEILTVEVWEFRAAPGNQHEIASANGLDDEWWLVGEGPANPEARYFLMRIVEATTDNPG